MPEETRITPKPNGPLVVQGPVKIVTPDGRELAVPPRKDGRPAEVVVLCRCGGSANKPYCDGTHKRNGFSSARVGGGEPDRVDIYQAKGVTIRDNRSICAHAGHCTDGLATVFKYGSDPWIDPAGASADAI